MAEVSPPIALEHVLQDGLDARRFDVRQPARADRVGDIGHARDSHVVPAAGEGLFQGRIGPPGVQIAGVLGQDRGDERAQDVVRMVLGLPDAHTVSLRQQRLDARGFGAQPLRGERDFDVGHGQL